MTGNVNTRICSSCQAETDADAIFCNECGAMQTNITNDAKSICPNCRQSVVAEDKFCHSCAFNLSKKESAGSQSANGGTALATDNLSAIENVRSAPKINRKIRWEAEKGKQSETANVSGLAINDKNAAEKDNQAESFNRWKFEEEFKSSGNTPSHQEKSFAPNLVSAAMKRYGDGYRVASAMNGFGSVFKAIGLIIGFGIFFLGLLMGQSMAEYAGAGSLIISGISSGISGGVIGIFFWIIGIWISAQGQILKAQLDAAVHTSPFLSETEKARVMSLPVSGTPNVSNEDYDSNISLEPNVKASLAYGLSFILSLLWLPVPIYFLMTTPKENRFIRLHSLQSIILNSLLFIIGLFGTFTGIAAIYYGVWCAGFIANLFCIWKAYDNEEFKLPVIGDLALNLSENSSSNSRSSN